MALNRTAALCYKAAMRLRIFQSTQAGRACLQCSGSLNAVEASIATGVKARLVASRMLAFGSGLSVQRGSRFLLTPLFVCAVMFVSPPEAQAYGYIQGGARLEGHLNVGHAGALGIGGRVDIPLERRGLIRGTHDELALSPGVTAFFGSGFWMRIPVMVQWNFYINPYWSLFPELGLAVVAGEDITVEPTLSMGARYHFNSRNALVIRLNWPTVLQVGITF